MHAIRRRLAGDAGISIVEMIVAIFILTVAVFALLGGLIASTQSLADQRFRAAATRVAANYMEGYRVLGYEEVLALLEAGDLDGSEEVVSLDGRTFTVNVSAAEAPADPEPLVDTPEAGPANVVLITIDVAWSLHNGTKSATYTTAIGPRNDPNAGLSDTMSGARIVAVNTHPNPSAIQNNDELDNYGRPTKSVAVVAVLQGFTETALVTASWTNKQPDGTTGSLTLVSSDGGVSWTGTIATSTLWYPLDPDEAEFGADIEIELAATLPSGAIHSRLHSLGLVEAPDNPPVIVDISSSHDPLTVHTPPGQQLDDSRCKQQTRCLNAQDLTFTVDVDALEPDDAVRMTFQVLDGTFQELMLVRDENAVMPEGQTRWVVEIPADSVKLKRGNDQPFNVTVTRMSDGAFASQTLARLVTWHSS